MNNPNVQPLTQSDSPIELELLALKEVMAHPATIEMQLLFLGGIAVAKAIESAIEEPEAA